MGSATVNYWFLGLSFLCGVLAVMVAGASLFNLVHPRVSFSFLNMLINAAVIAVTAAGAIYFYQHA